jgi:CRP-like cAMP-binding protein
MSKSATTTSPQAALSAVHDSVLQLLLKYQGRVLCDLLETELATLAKICKVNSFTASQTAVALKEKHDKMYVVLSGTFGVMAPSSQEAVRIERGEPFGDVPLILGRQRECYLECINPGRLIMITKANIDTVLESRAPTFWRRSYDDMNAIIAALRPRKPASKDSEIDQVKKAASATVRLVVFHVKIMSVPEVRHACPSWTTMTTTKPHMP